MNMTYPKYGIKLIFAIISVLLMLPLIAEHTVNFYRTVFIYQIGVTLDLLFSNQQNKLLFFNIWDIINQILGVFACAYAFACMVDQFAEFVEPFINNMNSILMLCIISCLLEEMLYIFWQAIRIKITGNRLRKIQREVQ